MVDDTIYQHTGVLLDELLSALDSAGLMSDQTPSSQALQSTAPFACDSMSFQAWLQFIFVPRMCQLIEQQQPLPTDIALTPMAEETLVGIGGSDEIIRILKRIDTLLSDQ